MGANRTVICYAESREGKWEAVCLDFDIAVQGDSFEGVVHDLGTALHLYLQSVAGLPDADRKRLLARRVPLGARVQMAISIMGHALARAIVYLTNHTPTYGLWKP